MSKLFSIFLLVGVMVVNSLPTFAQSPVIQPKGVPRPIDVGTTTPTTPTPETVGRPQPTGRGDSVQRRDYSDDSLKVNVYYFNASKPVLLDTSIRDFTTRFPIPATNIFLGNNGSASRSLLFSTPARTGFDPGFHSFDIYKWRLENVRFYNTPRPYTELGYVLGSGAEQLIEVLHTQNIRPFWNASFQYRLINAPGTFRNQKNNHNNYQFTSWYQSPAKRYNNYFVILYNKLLAGENGGIKTDIDYLESPLFERRYTIPTNIGGSPVFGAQLFSNALNTGREEKEFTFLLKQQYDLGRKDSLVTDSTVIPLFYPRLRFEHSLQFSKSSYKFRDVPAGGTGANEPDSVFYDSLYKIVINPGDSVFLQDRWREVTNDFSLYQFPDVNNLQQFIKLGTSLQLLKGTFNATEKSFYNVIGHGEYRNRTKNQFWDLHAFGRLHLAGFNVGDYHAYVSLQRLLSQRLGTLQVGFENINRSPSFIYNQQSSFYLDAAKNFSKENTAHFFGSYFLPKLGLQLKGDYYFVTNYLFLDGYRTLQQENALFNALRISGLKTFKLSRAFNWHAEVYLQPKAGGAAVNLPFFYTRNRIALEGKFFRNLNLSTGVEIRYHSPYKADNYSPVLGQFFYQDTLTIHNRPDVHAFAHFRIKSFKAYVRIENLNTINFSGGFGFNHNSLSAPAYPNPGMVFRLGIYWAFVN